MTERFHTHYDNLKVASDAPLMVIRAAYRALSQQYHPDKNPNDPRATRIMAILNASYDVLSDPAKRKLHDAEIARRRQQSEQARMDSAPKPKAAHQPSSPPHRPTSGKAQSSVSRPAPTEFTSNGYNWPIAIIILAIVALPLLVYWRLPEPTSRAPTATVPTYLDPLERSRNSSSLLADTRTTAPTERTPAIDAVMGRVTSQALNLRLGPGVEHPVIRRLLFAEEVKVTGSDNDGWLAVSYNGEEGYVNGAFIAIGESQTTLQKLCPLEPLSPANGTVFTSTQNGEHSLTVTAPESDNLLLKLKDRAGTSVFLAYVEQGRTVTFNTIPDGDYQAWFATGKAFSKKCGRFTEGSIVSFDSVFRNYRIQQAGYQRYATTHMTYKLRRTQNGNFQPMQARPEQF